MIHRCRYLRYGLLCGSLTTTLVPQVSAGKVNLHEGAQIEDTAFEQFIESKVQHSVAFQALPNRLHSAAVQVDIEDTYDDLSIQGGVKHRPAGHADEDYSDLSAYVTATLPLYDWGRVEHRVEAAKKEHHAQVRDNEASVVEISEQVIADYFEYLRLQKELELMQLRLTSLTDHEQDLQRKYRSGAGARLELDYIQSEIKANELEQRAVQLELARVASDFQQRYGELPDVTTLPQFAAAPERLDPGLEDSSATVLAEKQRLAASQALLESQRSEHWPALDFKVSYQEDNREYELFTTLELSYNAYQGGRKQLVVKEQQYAVTDQMYNLQLAREETRRKLQKTITGWHTAQQQSELYAELAEAKWQAAALARTQLTYSRGRLRDIYDYEKVASDYELKALQATLDLLAARYQFKLLSNEQ